MSEIESASSSSWLNATPSRRRRTCSETKKKRNGEPRKIIITGTTTTTTTKKNSSCFFFSFFLFSSSQLDFSGTVWRAPFSNLAPFFSSKNELSMQMSSSVRRLWIPNRVQSRSRKKQSEIDRDVPKKTSRFHWKSRFLLPYANELHHQSIREQKIPVWSTFHRKRVDDHSSDWISS